MRCPSCGADITDPAAVFCPRCATPLAAEEGATTTRIHAVGEKASQTPARTGSETESLEPLAPAAQEPSIARPRVDLRGVRARLEASGWVDTAAVAGLGFLVLLMIGAILVVAAKLNFPALGGNGDALGAFTAVVLAALGVLGIPIVVDGVAIYALPLGALIAAGAGYTWAASSSGKAPVSTSLVAAARWGAQLAAPTALLCWFFALVFRFRGDHPVAADAGAALIAGAFWGATFGIIAAATRIDPLRAVIARLIGGVRARSRRTYEGLVCGVTMLGGAAILGIGALLLWIIVALVGGAPAHHFGAGDAFAYLVYVIAFLPNIVVAVVSMSFGAPLEVGARVDLGGRVVGPLREYSLWEWGRGEPLPILFLLVVIPLLACVWAGVSARRRADDPGAMLHVLLVASAVSAVTLTLVGAIGRLRLAGVVKGSGYAAVAPDPLLVFVLSFLACGVLGALGWWLVDASAVPALSGED